METEFIENKIFRLCAQPRTFQYISKNLDGLDPTVLIVILKKLEKKETLNYEGDMWSVKEKTKPLTLNLTAHDPQLYLKKYMGYFDFLQTPHPLDFEWRNSTSSLNYLIEKIQDDCSVADKILFLGMPTLFATACLKDVPQQITLVERNKPIVNGLTKLHKDKERFKILEMDIFKVKPEVIGKYDYIIMDPPWYSPFFIQFMWLASKCVEIGGTIGISLPPLNTRPKIVRERIGWIDYCHRQGLCLENLNSQKLHYSMPFFEFNAFRAAGIDNILPFWRKGDLAFFRKISSKSTTRPIIKNTPVNWVEKEIKSVRFRIRKNGHTNKLEELKIESLIKGDILQTVSSRDKRRNNANLWTSGNRIFNVTNVNLFLSTIDNIKSKNKVFTKDDKMVSQFIDTITNFEKKEYDDYLNWLYHEMERMSN